MTYNSVFLSDAPVVKVTNIFNNPYANSVATARTCYSSKIISVDDVLKNTEQMNRIATSTYDAGHHTTLQHTSVQFSLTNISRHFVWAFLHDNSNYNSEEMSQRFVKMRPDSVIVPKFETESALQAYTSKTKELFEVYEKLIELLTPAVDKEYYKIFPARQGKDKYASNVRKKAQEVARYVLPIGMYSSMYHTVPLITLLRYNRMCLQNEVADESFFVVQEMIDQVVKYDPNLLNLIEDPLAMSECLETKMADFNNHMIVKKHQPFYDQFDEHFTDGFKFSKLISYTQGAEELLRTGFNEMFGLDYATNNAIITMLSAKHNPLLTEKMNVLMHSKIGQCLKQVSYTFKKRLSHTGDSQNKRHRTVSGARLPLYYPASPDYMVPELIRHVPEAEELYRKTVESIWSCIDQHFIDIESPTLFMYLLPNAVNVRMTETGNLMDLWHKYKMRLCYNAQEEIWRASVEEVQQIRKVHPYIGHCLLPPCTIRKMGGAMPFCPEGDRYCGVPVWNYDLSSYERLI